MKREHRILIQNVPFGVGRYEVRLQQKCRFLFWQFWDTLSFRKFANKIDGLKLAMKWQGVYGVTDIVDKSV